MRTPTAVGGWSCRCARNQAKFATFNGRCPASLEAAPRAATPAAPPLAEAPVAGAQYRVRDHLNLREHTGIDARRLAVVPAGTRVTATGRRRGDWWQVSAVVDGRRLEGWASSLWLRRADENSMVF